MHNAVPGVKEMTAGYSEVEYMVSLRVSSVSSFIKRV